MHAVHTEDTHVHIKAMVCPERVFFLNSVISATGCLVVQMCAKVACMIISQPLKRLQPNLWHNLIITHTVDTKLLSFMLLAYL